MFAIIRNGELTLNTFLIKNRILFIFTLIILPLSPNSFASVVKMSKSEICHDVTSPHYERLNNFKPFESIKSCLNNGGRLPKNTKKLNRASNNTELSYQRNAFGHGWADIDRDCQNSRMEALKSQSVSNVRYKTSKECMVMSGRWISPFTGQTIYDASVIDIDHVVPLKWAWDHGAHLWHKDKRKKLANDPANLLSVERSLNRQKGAKGLDKWLPPKNKCQYIVRFERIYKTYDLVLTNAEKAAYLKIKTKNCGK